MALSPETVAIVKATAPVVAEHAVAITRAFYPLLFTNNPEALRYFNKTNQVKGLQQQALAAAVVAYASNIENLGALSGLVSRMAHRHVALSITPELYPMVHKNLMLAIAEVLGDAVTPEVGEAWSEAVLALAKILMAAEEELYRKCEGRLGGWRGEREFVLEKKTRLSKDIIAFDFAPADGYSGGFAYEPGQYLTIRVPTHAPRHYTITSASGSRTIQCTTRLLPGGSVSTFMHTEMEVGDKCLLGPPSGWFTPHPGSADVALISAGVGVTPMWAFLNHLGRERVKLALHVDGCAERHAYREEFERSGVECQWIYTESAGRPEAGALAKAAVAAVGTEGDFYVCCPVAMMEAVVLALREAGAHGVFLEKFGTG